MAIDTFNPSVAPSPGTRRSVDLALNKVSFGDGYTQTSPKGLNHQRLQLALKWAAVTPAQLKELEDFFTSQGGYKPFWFTYSQDGVRRKWTCADWSSDFSAPNSFSATLVENFSTTV